MRIHKDGQELETRARNLINPAFEPHHFHLQNDHRITYYYIFRI